jgi:hypothetical protein
LRCNWIEPIAPGTISSSIKAREPLGNLAVDEAA